MIEEPKKIPIHGAEGFSVSESAEAIPEAERIIVKKEDLKPPQEFEKGAALINLIVNVKDIRDPKDGEIGALYPEQAAEFEARIESFMDQIYNTLPAEERSDLDVVVIAGETHLVTPGPNGLRSAHQRAMETGDRAIAGILKSMTKHDIDPEEVLTTQHGRPIATNILNDLRLMHPLGSEGEKEFHNFLVKRYGAGRDFWKAFEEDAEQVRRTELRAEGPTDISDRVDHFVSIATTIVDLHQEGNPQKRVVIFAIGHYDNLSPWVKSHLAGIDPAKGFVPMEKGGGLVIKRSSDKTAETSVGARTFAVKLESLV
ncbi:MAG: hypothetical protein WC831_02470 [Parcubacteria group bacterium]|jgi:hypothetical protein